MFVKNALSVGIVPPKIWVTVCFLVEPFPLPSLINLIGGSDFHHDILPIDLYIVGSQLLW